MFNSEIMGNSGKNPIRVAKLDSLSTFKAL